MFELIRITDSTGVCRIINLGHVSQIKHTRNDRTVTDVTVLKMIDNGGEWIELRGTDAAELWQYLSERALDLKLLNAAVPVPVPSPAA